MPDQSRQDSWISAETEQKERDFRGILGMHIRICKSILSRYPGPPYLYADLHAGPGNLEFNGRRFDGSPLIFLDLAKAERIRYQSLYFDSDPATAARLGAAISWVDGIGSAEVCAEACEMGMSRWLARSGHQPKRHGLIYADPIGKEIPHALLARAATALPRVDILSYTSATGYKRRGGTRLREHIEAVGKRHVYVRDGAGAWQWTFILWTNWDNFPEWKRIGFHRVDSERGQQILRKLNHTSAEIHEMSNTPLPFPFEAPAVPDVCRVPAAPQVPGDQGGSVQEGLWDV